MFKITIIDSEITQTQKNALYEEIIKRPELNKKSLTNSETWENLSISLNEPFLFELRNQAGKYKYRFVGMVNAEAKLWILYSSECTELQGKVSIRRHNSIILTVCTSSRMLLSFKN